MLAATPFLGRLAALDGTLAIILKIAATAVVFLDIATVANPVETQRNQTLLRIAFRAFRVVILERRVWSDTGGVGQFDFGVRHFQIVRAELVFEMHQCGLAYMCLVALLGIAGCNIHTLLLGQLGSSFSLLGVGELLFTCLGRLLSFFHGSLHTRRITMLLIAAHRLPTRHHLTGGCFRIVRTRNRGHYKPAGRFRTCQHLHIVGMHTAADHHRKFACRANRIDLLLVKRMSGTVVAAHGSLRLGSGHMQRAGADVIDAAVRQLVDELHQAFGFGGQANDGVLAEQCAGFTRLHIGLTNMYTVHFDALVAGLPHHVHAVVDHERHGIGLAVIFDDLRDVACHFGDVLRIRVLSSQLDERRAPAQRVIYHIRHRPALAILRADHKIRAHVETVAH